MAFFYNKTEGSVDNNDTIEENSMSYKRVRRQSRNKKQLLEMKNQNFEILSSNSAFR